MSNFSATLLCALLGASCALAVLGWRISISRHRQAKLQLDHTRREIAGILDNLGSGLIILDRTGAVRRFNNSARRILGISGGDPAGMGHREALGEAAAEFSVCLAKVLESGLPLVREEVRIDRGPVSDVPVGVTVTPILDGEQAVEGVMAIFQDLTEVVRMRDRIRESDRLAAVGELSASIAHEIRNPLGSIRGSAELLAAELKLDGSRQRLLDLILKESGRVNQIISDFLGFARLRPTRTRPVNICEFIEQVVFQIRLQVQGRAGDVDIALAVPDQERILALDEEQMTQVFLNLALNACEAMEYRGRLLISVADGSAAGECLLSVEDDGPGIPVANRVEIFKPFFTTRKGGTGLGLPMVARIVSAHGGNIKVDESRYGGAGFRMELPLSAAIPAAEPQVEATSDLAGDRVSISS